jgi:hypothetical protein
MIPSVSSEPSIYDYVAGVDVRIWICCHFLSLLDSQMLDAAVFSYVFAVI